MTNAIVKLANRKVIAALATMATLSGGVSAAYLTQAYASADETTPSNSESQSDQNMARAKYGASIEGAAANADGSTGALDASPLLKDDNTGTFEPKSTNYTLIINLGRPSSINSIKLRVDGSATTFRVAYSNDKTNWTDVGGDQTVPSGNYLTVDKVTSPIRAQYVRLTASGVTLPSDTTTSYKLSDLQVMGPVEKNSITEIKTTSKDGKSLVGLPGNVPISADKDNPNSPTSLNGFDVDENGAAYFHPGDSHDIYVKSQGVGTITPAFEGAAKGWSISSGQKIEDGFAKGYTKYTVSFNTTNLKDKEKADDTAIIGFTSSTGGKLSDRIAVKAYAKTTRIVIVADYPVASVGEKGFRIHAVAYAGEHPDDVENMTDDHGLYAIQKFTYKATPTSVATVTDNGNVTFVKEGNVKFTATSKDTTDVVGERTVVVKPAADASVEYKISGLPDSRVLKPGATAQLKLVDQSGKDYDGKVTWSSSDDKTATVDETGKVTGVAESKDPVTITAKIDDGRQFQAQLTVSNTDKAKYTIEDLAKVTANYDDTAGTAVHGFNYKTSAVEVSGAKTAVKINDNSKVKLQNLPEGWIPGNLPLKDANGKVIGQKFGVTDPDGNVVATYQFVYQSAYDAFTGNNTNDNDNGNTNNNGNNSGNNGNTVSPQSDSTSVDKALANVKVYVDGKVIDNFKYDTLEYKLKSKPQAVQVTGVPDSWTVANATASEKGAQAQTKSNDFPNNFTDGDLEQIGNVTGKSMTAAYGDSSVTTPVKGFTFTKSEYTNLGLSAAQLSNMGFISNGMDNEATMKAIRGIGYDADVAKYDANGSKLPADSQASVYTVLTLRTSDSSRAATYFFTSADNFDVLKNGSTTTPESGKTWTVDPKTFGATETDVKLQPAKGSTGNAVTYSLKYGNSNGGNGGSGSVTPTSLETPNKNGGNAGRDLAKTGAGAGILTIVFGGLAGIGEAMRRMIRRRG